MDGPEKCLLRFPHGYQGQRHLDMFTEIHVESVLSGQVLAQYARRAWQRLRYKHPSMAAHSIIDRLEYKKPTQVDLWDWLQETFIVLDKPHVSVYEVINAPHNQRTPTMFFLLQSATFVLYVPHHYNDALGMAIFCNDFLQEISKDVIEPQKNPQFGDEASNLAPCLEEVECVEPTPEHRAKVRSALKDLWTTSGSLSPRSTTHEVFPGKTNWQDLILDDIETSRLVHSAKANNITVTHAVHAALVQATATQDQKCRKDFLSAIFFNQRSYTGQYPGKICLDFALRIGVWGIKIRPLWFMLTADLLKEKYESLKNEHYPTSLTWSEFTSHFLSGNSNSIVHIITSPGRLDRYVSMDYGPIQVKNIHFILQHQMQGIIAIIQSFAGRLRLRVEYNESYFRQEDITGYLALVKRELFTGMRMVDMI
ncbi:hypothetical protein ETB97_012734 [Aspergillus alliaceus]|uniref:Uncharacterized protein n=1 Tax=Petromyces alliaceus TaxID=209559 RepID=A0A5N6FH23_PETAA|nr:uncharacterized protein BDW43DRAFT_315534 [Aspergillus alliaceus]KAB8228897.1 hypothetical protein BDW43DRAFT_315534 [Aspergillus alliaceus]KAF5861647.1 hypothetical protein ETB97_012734 [Aspergillus burnettii]